MAVDLVIDIENTPGALAEVAAAISDAGVTVAAATCLHPQDRAELHILVKHAEAAKHALAISHVGVSRERIRQLEARALRQMRAICAEQGRSDLVQ